MVGPYRHRSGAAGWWAQEFAFPTSSRGMIAILSILGAPRFIALLLFVCQTFLRWRKRVWGKPPHHTFLLCIVIAGTSPRKGPQIQASPARKRLKKHVCAAALLQESMAGSGSHSPLARSKHPFCMISTHFLSCPRKPASDFKTTNHGGKG